MGRILVTGGTGYLGRHLVAALKQRGNALRILARPSSDIDGLQDGGDVEVVRGDVTRREDVAAALDGITRVFHGAAEVRDGLSRDAYDAVNHQAVETLLALAHERDVERVVCTSSYFAVGRTGLPRSAPDQVADEYWTHDPSDMHDAHEESKYDGENAVNQHVSTSEPVLALMPTMMYGPELAAVSGVDDLRPGNRILRMLADHAAGRYPGIPGDGEQIWNLVHVADVAAGHVAAMESGDDSGTWPPPGFLHWHYFLGGENVTVNELFSKFGALAGVAAPGHVKPRGGLLGKLLGSGDPRSPERFAMDSHSWAYSSDFAAKDFAYRARPLAEGLAETVAWMRSHGLLPG